MSRTLTAADRSALIRLASTMEKGSPERKAILAGLSKSAVSAGARVVFHAETPRGGTIVKAYDDGDGSFHWEETEIGRGTSHSPVASGSASSEAVLVKMLNNHFRSYREFDPRRFKVVINDMGVRV